MVLQRRTIIPWVGCLQAIRVACGVPVARPNPKGAPSAARGRSWATSLYTFTGTLIYRESFTIYYMILSELPKSMYQSPTSVASAIDEMADVIMASGQGGYRGGMTA